MEPQLLPHTVYLDPRSKDSPLARRVLSRLSGAIEVRDLEGRGDPLSRSEPKEGAEPDNLSRKKQLADRFSTGKRQLVLTRYDGEWLKPCPGTDGHVCCNLWIVNPGEGCPMDCTYCYLQSYLIRNPTLKIYTNPEEMIAAIGARADAEPGRLFRVGTGEVIDSLVFDELTDLSLELVPFFGAKANLVLELKTKSDCVSNLLSIPESVHRGKTVVSWSVNAETVTRADEAFTAPLERRIDAAARVAAAGYRVGFHFDPLIHFEGWEEEYRSTIDRIFSAVPPERVAWVSLSSLRYQPEMQEIMMRRFPESRLPFGEQFLGSDRKLRYLQPLRFELLNSLRTMLKAKRQELPVYMCMESAAAWRQLTGGPPAAGAELAEVFSRRGSLHILPESH